MSSAKNKPAKEQVFQIVILVFLITIMITVVIGFLISNTSVALFSNTSETVTFSFSSGALAEPTQEENLEQLIQHIKNVNLFQGSNHQYSASGVDPHNAWSRRIEDYLIGETTNENIFNFKNLRSGSKAVVNLNTLALDDSLWNPAIFIADGADFNYDSIPTPPLSEEEFDYTRLWGTMMIYKSFGRDERIYYFYIDENGFKGELNSIRFN